MREVAELTRLAQPQTATSISKIGNLSMRMVPFGPGTPDYRFEISACSGTVNLSHKLAEHAATAATPADLPRRDPSPHRLEARIPA
jgi:hypothetical protein